MFDSKKRYNLTLSCGLEAEEFRRVAVRRKVEGAAAAADCHAPHTAVSSGVWDLCSCGHACDRTCGSHSQVSAEEDAKSGFPPKPQMPPKPAHLQGPLRVEAHNPTAGNLLPQRVCDTKQDQSPIAGPEVHVSSVSPARNCRGSPGPVRGCAGALTSPARPQGGIQSLASSPTFGSPSPSKRGIQSCSPLKEGGHSPAKLSTRSRSPLAGKLRTPSPVQGRMRSYSPARSSKTWLRLPKIPSGKMDAREKRAGKSLSVPDLMVYMEESRIPAEQGQRSLLKLWQSANCQESAVTAEPPLNQRLNHSMSESCLSGSGKERSPGQTKDVSHGKACAVLNLTGTNDRSGDGGRSQGCGSEISSQWNETALEDGGIHKESECEQNEKRKAKGRGGGGGGGGQEAKGEEKTEQKLYNIASELLQTERAYVARLHLLDQVFCLRLTEEAGRGSFPPEVIRSIFSNISSIYSFHSQFLLPDLEDCISHWCDNPGMGNVLLQHAPFLRMYADYVRNFDQAMELVRTWTERSAAFRNIIQDIQSQEACCRLTLQHHMLEPVQRVPRYEMLLGDYLKKLPEDNPDYEVAQKSLQTISLAATHSNSAIRRAESLKRLMEIYEMLGEEEVINPTNEFIREGRLLKLAARNMSSMERHLLLFNNFLLCCTPKFSLLGQRFTVRCRIGVDGMHVEQTTNEDHPYSFQVSGKEKTLELQASSEQDRDEWIKVIQKAIDAFQKKNESFKLASKEPHTEEPLEELGRRAPRWIRDNEVTVCMKCREPFNALTRRRHHCRACGCVVCWKCSDNKVPLEYDGNKLNRVCKACYSILIGRRGEKVEGKKRRTLELDMSPESSESVMSGFLLYGDTPETWQHVWCAISRREPLVLCLYTASQDATPLTCIPLLGCSVKDSPQELQGQPSFCLSQPRTTHTFSCDSPHLKQSWMAVLEVAVTGKMPAGTLRGPDSTSNGSRCGINDEANDVRVSSDEEFTVIGSVESHS